MARRHPFVTGTVVTVDRNSAGWLCVFGLRGVGGRLAELVHRFGSGPGHTYSDPLP